MSNQEITRVIRESKFDGTDLLALVLLADQATDEGLCYGRISTIAKKIRKSERQASRVISNLNQGGELGVIQRKGRTNAYLITAGLTRALIQERIAFAVQEQGYKAENFKLAEGPEQTSTPDVDVTSTPDIAMSGTPDVDVTSHTNPFLSPQENPPAEPERGKSEKEDKPVYRNMVFEIVALRGFQIENLKAITDPGRIGTVCSWIKKHLAGMVDDEMATKTTEFYDWWDREHDSINAPRDIVKFREHWTAFENEGSRDKDGYTSRQRV